MKQQRILKNSCTLGSARACCRLVWQRLTTVRPAIPPQAAELPPPPRIRGWRRLRRQRGHNSARRHWTEPFRVALFYPGSNDDLSWSNAWFDGARGRSPRTPIEIEYVELLNEPEPSFSKAQHSLTRVTTSSCLLTGHGRSRNRGGDELPRHQVCVAPHHPAPDAGQARQPVLDRRGPAQCRLPDRRHRRPGF